MIFAGVIFFNDGPALFERCLIALKNIGIKTIAVDGAYQDFPHNKPWSTDGCVDVARKHADIFVPCSAAWVDQPTKRNQYLARVLTNDYIFVIDADEIVSQNPINEADLIDPIYDVMTDGKPGRWKRTATTRIYKVFPTLRYAYQHCRLYDWSKHNVKDIESGLITKAHGNEPRKKLLDSAGQQVFLFHKWNERSEARAKDKKIYYAKREEAKHGY